MKTFKIDALYIHFPYCRHLCNYCDFYKNLNSLEANYSSLHDYLEKSFQKVSALIEREGYVIDKLNTVYIGGGTPSLWGASGAKFLKQFFIKNRIELASRCEFTLEVNPGSWNEDGLKSWKDIGVNRYSLGIQSLNPFFLKALDRIHNVSDVRETLSYFSSQSLNFSVDFMLGLPFSDQKKRKIITEIEELMSFNPQHFSLYILTVKDNYVYNKSIPSEEWIEREYLEICDYLRSQDYLHYEVSNFSKSGFESLHNLKYWDNESVLALGPSATGLLSEKGIRYKWKVKEVDWVREDLSEESRKLEKLYMILRTNRGIRGSDFFSGDDLLKYESIILNWEERGLGQVSGEQFRLTSKGYLVMDGLIDQMFIQLKSL